jgi:hypothetical protein
MMLISQLRFVQVKNKESKNLATMNALALMAFLLTFLFSTLAHADHIATHALNAEQQECYICHQEIDTPPELPHVRASFSLSYNANIYDVVTAQFKVDDFFKPQLRAPPVVP